MKKSNPLNSTGPSHLFCISNGLFRLSVRRSGLWSPFRDSWIVQSFLDPLSREFLLVFIFQKVCIIPHVVDFLLTLGEKSLNFTVAFLSDREVTDQCFNHMDLPRQNNICFSWVHHSGFLRIVSFYASFRTFLSCFAKRRVHLFFLPTALDTFSRPAYTRTKWLSTILHTFKASSHTVASRGKLTTQEEM